MTVKKCSPVEREILRPLWKVHILHHAREAPIVGHWMLGELRAHGYLVSPGTLYPLLGRLCRLGWLEPVASPGRRRRHRTTRYRLTAAGRAVLREVEARLAELRVEVFMATRRRPRGGGEAARPRHRRETRA